MTDVFKGSTSHTFYIELVDSTTGLPKTVILYTDVTGSYVRSRAARTSITMATLASASAAFSSGGFILVDDTNQPGVYRFDIPDAAFASGVDEVIVTVKATGCRTQSRRFTLVDINNQVAYAPNVVAGGTNGLFIAGTNAATTITTGLTTSFLGTLTAVTTVNGLAAGVITDAAIAADAFTAAKFAADVTTEFQAGLATAANLATVAGYLDTEIAAILADTNELQTDWVNGGRLDLILDARSSQTSVDDLPTNAELATALGTADDAVLAAIATVQADTDNIQTRIPAALTADGNIKADTLRVGGTLQTADDLAALIVAAATNVTTILGKFTGITLLAQWLGALAGKQTPNSTALTEINATGAGSGGYSAITDSQEALRDRGDVAWITGSSGAGTGARSVTITVNDGATVLQSATVRMTQGAESYVVLTNVSGVAVFALDDATWTVTVTKAGYTFTPTTIIVNGTETATYSMTAVTITPSDPGETTGYVTIRTLAGVDVSGAVVDVEVTRWANGTTGSGITPRMRSRTTDVNGYAEFTGLPRLATYRVRVNDGEWTSAAVTLDAATTPLAAPIGPVE